MGGRGVVHMSCMRCKCQALTPSSAATNRTTRSATEAPTNKTQALPSRKRGAVIASLITVISHSVKYLLARSIDNSERVRFTGLGVRKMNQLGANYLVNNHSEKTLP
jgi:hypothetical protein